MVNVLVFPANAHVPDKIINYSYADRLIIK